jgi:ribosomal protein S27AE
MTAEEFERQYAERSGITVEKLRAWGRIVAPCDCGADMCEGWQSTTPERIADEQYRENPQPYIVCPKCGMVSHNPNDVRERYCGNCHAFHADLEKGTL